MFSGAVKDVRLLIMEWEFHEPQWKMLGRKATMGCWIRQEDDSTAEMTREGDQGYQSFTSLKNPNSPWEMRETLKFCQESAYHVDFCLTLQKEYKYGSSSKTFKKENCN